MLVEFLTVGTSRTSLQNIAIDVFNSCSACNIKFIPQWISLEQNGLGDHYSRINDTDNRTIDDGNYELISNLYPSKHFNVVSTLFLG